MRFVHTQRRRLVGFRLLLLRVLRWVLPVVYTLLPECVRQGVNEYIRDF